MQCFSGKCKKHNTNVLIWKEFRNKYFHSLLVILHLLSDVWMCWWSSQSVESFFHPLPVCSFVVNQCLLFDLVLMKLLLWIFMDESILTLHMHHIPLPVKPEEPWTLDDEDNPSIPYSDLLFSTHCAWEIVIFWVQFLLWYN